MADGRPYPALDLRYAPGPGTGALQDLLYAELDAFEPTAIQEHEAGDGWRIFFRGAAARDAARAALAPLLREAGGQLLDLRAVDVADQGWARRSQAGLKAIRADRIIVAPPWDVPPRDPSLITIVIEPSMGFGTGHHETTRLCLNLLQDGAVEGSRVIDVGTGSGVLAIAAWKLGASAVVAIDNDPDALLNARENVARNGAAAAVDVREADLSSASLPPAGIVTANLTGAVLQAHAGALLRLVYSGGTLIVSGFSPEESGAVLAALGGRPSCVVRDGEWAAAMIRRQAPG